MWIYTKIKKMSDKDTQKFKNTQIKMTDCPIKIYK